MRDVELRQALSPLHVVAATIWGEARGESVIGRAAVGSVIQNRVAAQRPHWGLTAKAVCLAPSQFSCWMPSAGLANYESTIDAARAFHRGHVAGQVSRECIDLAVAIVAGRLEDVVAGATHYLTRHLFESDCPPGWAAGKLPRADIGAHVFLKVN